jgi:cytochrome c-type biogenesis protein CcmH
MRRFLRLAPWVLMALLCVGALSVATMDDGPPSAASRIRNLESQIRCPTCRAQSTLESNAPIAKAVRTEVAKRVEAGESDDAILSYMASRYGAGVLLDPKTSGTTALVWFLPVLAVLGAVGGMAFAYPRWRARARAGVSAEDVELVAAARRARPATGRKAARGGDIPTDLSEQRAYLLTALDELEADHRAGVLDESTFESLRDDTTVRAAAVLRAIEQRRAAVAAAPSPSTPVARRRRGLLVALGGSAAFVFLALVLAGAATTERAPGQASTGGLPTSNAARLATARELIRSGNGLQALRYYKDVLDQDPANVEALSWRGLVVAMNGRPDVAMDDLNAAVAADPSYPEAHFFRGMVLANQLGDVPAGTDELHKALAASPAPELSAQINDALKAIEDRSRAGAEGDTNAAGPPGTNNP